MGAGVAEVVGRLFRHARRERRVARCFGVEVRSESDIREAAARLAPVAAAETAAVAHGIRELVALNSPALFLNIVQRGGGPLRVVLRPWDGRSVRFRGSNYFVDLGSGAPEGVEAFLRAPLAHVTALYPTVPDHPVYVLSIEHQGHLVYTGDFPAFLTHATVAMNGLIVARAHRLLHERGPQVFWAA